MWFSLDKSIPVIRNHISRFSRDTFNVIRIWIETPAGMSGVSAVKHDELNTDYLSPPVMVWWFNTQVNPSHPSAKHSTAMAAMGNSRPTKLHHFGTEASHILEFSAVWSYFEPCLSILNFINHGFPWGFQWFSMGFPWVFHGFSMGFQCCSIFFPTMDSWTVGTFFSGTGIAKSHHLETQRATGLDDQITCRGNQKKSLGWYDVIWTVYGCIFIYLAAASYLYLSVWLQL